MFVPTACVCVCSVVEDDHGGRGDCGTIMTIEEDIVPPAVATGRGGTLSLHAIGAGRL